MTSKMVLKTLVVFGSFLFVLPVFATSGACSYHDGVNCGTGPDYDGSVICNDGWSESSVAYLSANECQNNISCNDSEYSALLAKYNIVSLKSEYQSLINQINAIKAQLQIDLAAVESKPIPMQSIIGQQNRLISDANFKIEPLSSQAENLRTDINFKISQVNSECETIGKNRIQEIAMTRLQMKINAEKEAETQRQIDMLAQEERLAKAQMEAERQNKAKTPDPVIPTSPTPVKPTIQNVPATVKVAKKPTLNITTTTSSTLQTTSTEKRTLTQIFNEQKEQKEQKVGKIKQFFNFLLNLFRK